MTPDARGNAPKPAHQKILEEEQVRAYHVVDVLFACQCIMDIAQVSIETQRRVPKRLSNEGHYRGHSIWGINRIAVQKAEKESEGQIYPVVRFLPVFW